MADAMGVPPAAQCNLGTGLNRRLASGSVLAVVAGSMTATRLSQRHRRRPPAADCAWLITSGDSAQIYPQMAGTSKRLQNYYTVKIDSVGGTAGLSSRVPAEAVGATQLGKQAVPPILSTLTAYYKRTETLLFHQRGRLPGCPYIVAPMRLAIISMKVLSYGLPMSFAHLVNILQLPQ